MKFFFFKLIAKEYFFESKKLEIHWISEKYPLSAIIRHFFLLSDRIVGY